MSSNRSRQEPKMQFLLEKSEDQLPTFLKTGQTGGRTSLISGSKARSEFKAFSKQVVGSWFNKPDKKVGSDLVQ